MQLQLLVFVAFLLAGFAVSPQQAQKPAGNPPAAEYKIPPEAVNQANPVKPTSSSLAQGKKSYGYDCAMCHGKNGDGQGDLAVDMQLKLADYREPAALKGRTDGELFYIIKNGKGQMPAEGDRANPNEIWNMVNYIRSFAKKEPAAKPDSETH